MQTELNGSGPRSIELEEARKYSGWQGWNQWLTTLINGHNINLSQSQAEQAWLMLIYEWPLDKNYLEWTGYNRDKILIQAIMFRHLLRSSAWGNKSQTWTLCISWTHDSRWKENGMEWWGLTVSHTIYTQLRGVFNVICSWFMISSAVIISGSEARM